MTNGIRRGWGVSVKPRPLFTPGKDLVPIVQEADWAPGPVWTGADNLAPTGIRSPDRPARSQSLYRPRYLAHENGKESSLSAHANGINELYIAQCMWRVTVHVVSEYPFCVYSSGRMTGWLLNLCPICLCWTFTDTWRNTVPVFKRSQHCWQDNAVWHGSGFRTETHPNGLPGSQHTCLQCQ